MNKALHVFVYLFLVLAGAALWFELQLNAQRAMLTDRNRLQEDFVVKLARTVEKDEAPRDVPAFEVKKDVSPVEARLVDSPEMENVLEEYKPYLETQNLDTFNWEGKREQLRAVYVMGPDDKPIMDGNRPKDSGPGTERELLDTLFEASSKQRARLDTTRAELTKLRGILADTVEELNKLKPVARQDKVTITEKEEKITKLEGEKSTLENQVKTKQSQIDELNGEITSLRDEVATAKDEAAENAEKLEEAEKNIARLQKMMKDMVQTSGGSSATGAAVSSVPFGDKGRIVEVDNEDMFAIVEFTPEALKELKGKDGNAPIPQIEFSVKRPGYTGEAGEFVGRVRIRQEVAGKNYVICDVLSAWRQTDMRADDVVFAD